MRIEDALFGVRIGADAASREGGAEWCRHAIEGGVDLVQWVVHPRDSPDDCGSLVAELAHVCRDGDAVFLVTDSPELAVSSGAHGVLMTGEINTPMGLVRATIGDTGLVGMTSQSLEDACLALEVGADYLIHFGGDDGVAIFKGAYDFAGIPVYAAGVTSVEEARAIVDSGHPRICVEADALEPGSVTDSAIKFSRVLGRCF